MKKPSFTYSIRASGLAEELQYYLKQSSATLLCPELGTSYSGCADLLSRVQLDKGDCFSDASYINEEKNVSSIVVSCVILSLRLFKS